MLESSNILIHITYMLKAECILSALMVQTFQGIKASSFRSTKHSVTFLKTSKTTVGGAWKNLLL